MANNNDLNLRMTTIALRNRSQYFNDQYPATGKAMDIAADMLEQFSSALSQIGGVALSHECCPDPTLHEDSWVRADDVKRLTRELDVAWNGKNGAAKQASLCDIVGQIIGNMRDKEDRYLCLTCNIVSWGTPFVACGCGSRKSVLAPE